MKPSFVCNYALIRFTPYRQTGEFVNVGIVLFCSETNFFDSRLENENQQRITNFFPEFDFETYMKTKNDFQAELQRIKQLLESEKNNASSAMKLGIFRELVKPRESLIAFGPIGTVLTEEPERKLSQLFDELVNRQFARVYAQP